VIHVLQDWTSVEGIGAYDVAQSGGRILDLSGYQDVTFLLDVASLSELVTMHYDTAPPHDPWLFKSMASVAVTGPQFTRTRVRLFDATTPLAGLVRWRISSAQGPTATWKVVFRIECFAKRARGGA
jgi:hypothetical protein